MSKSTELQAHSKSSTITFVGACAVNLSPNEKALKCKPSALIFGHGRAKKSLALQRSYNIGIHVKIM